LQMLLRKPVPVVWVFDVTNGNNHSVCRHHSITTAKNENNQPANKFGYLFERQLQMKLCAG
jgi:hypothetical protein